MAVHKGNRHVHDGVFLFYLRFCLFFLLSSKKLRLQASEVVRWLSLLANELFSTFEMASKSVFLVAKHRISGSKSIKV